MGKKKRIKKTTVFGSIEGIKREAAFFDFLRKLYFDSSKTSFIPSSQYGGNPNIHINLAIKNKNNFKKTFAWIDEDVDINSETKTALINCWKIKEKEAFFKCPLKDLQKTFNTKMRNPVLIVSNPVCVEAIIIKLLGKQVKYKSFDQSKREQQIQDLKNSLDGIIGDIDEITFYHNKLTKSIIDNKRNEIQELDILISMIT